MSGARLAIFSIVFGVFYFASFYWDLALFRYYPEVSQFHLLRNDRLGVVILWYGWIVTSALASAAIAFAVPRNLAERPLTLKGVFALDAIDDAGSVLYLLETVGPNQYRVRDYDLAADRLDDQVIVDKTDASPVMNGTRVATVATASSSSRSTVS